MPELLQNTVILILGFLSLCSITLYIREHSRRVKLSGNSQQLSEYKEKGLNLLYASMKQSQSILGEAELEGLKAVAEGKFSAIKLEKDYAAKLDEIIKHSEVSITEVQNKFIQYIQGLQGQSSSFEEQTQKLSQEKINQLFGKLEQRLSDFLVSTEQKTTYSIELELKSARQLIETYKNEQLALIDENIMSMMEQTLSLVLSKKLTLKDQLDLVYESLEKAKVEKFIV